MIHQVLKRKVSLAFLKKIGHLTLGFFLKTKFLTEKEKKKIGLKDKAQNQYNQAWLSIRSWPSHEILFLEAPRRQNDNSTKCQSEIRLSR